MKKLLLITTILTSGYAAQAHAGEQQDAKVVNVLSLMSKSCAIRKDPVVAQARSQALETSMGAIKQYITVSMKAFNETLNVDEKVIMADWLRCFNLLIEKYGQLIRISMETPNDQQAMMNVIMDIQHVALELMPMAAACQQIMVNDSDLKKEYVEEITSVLAVMTDLLKEVQSQIKA